MVKFSKSLKPSKRKEIEIIDLLKKYKNKKLDSLDFTIDDDSSLYSTIADTRNADPADLAIQNEMNANITADISFILNSEMLNQKQKDQIHMYYFEDKSLAEIGSHYGVTREAIRQNIKRALASIKNLV